MLELVNEGQKQAEDALDSFGIPIGLPSPELVEAGKRNRAWYHLATILTRLQQKGG